VDSLGPLGQLADLSPDGMLLSVSGTIVATNPAAARLLGARRAEDLIGRAVAELFDADLGALERRGGEAGGFRARLRLRRGDGAWQELDVTAVGSSGPAEGRTTHFTLRDPNLGREVGGDRTLAPEQLAALVREIPIPTCVWRRAADDFVLVYANESAISSPLGEQKRRPGVRASELGALQPGLPEFLARCVDARGEPRREMRGQAATAGGLGRILFMSGRFVSPDLVVVHTDDVTRWRELDEGHRVRDWVLEHSLSAIALADLEGTVTYSNLAFCRMWGFGSHAEVVGRPATDFWASPALAREVIRAVRDRGSWTGELVARKASGSLCDVHISANSVVDADGRPICLMASFVDVTEEKRMTEELHQLGDFNAQLLHVANVWVDVLDEEGNALLWNEEAERISGYARAEVVGHDRWWEWLYPDPAYRTETRRRRREALLEGKPFRGVESTIRTRGGEERVMSWYGRPLLGTNGRVWAVVVVGHDVTERRRSEQSLREYAVQVAQMNQEKTRFLSTASHELRTPLTAIRGFADLLARGEGLRPPQREMLARIRAQTDRLDTLLAELLTLSRRDLDGGRPSWRLAELGAVLERVVEVVRSQLALKGHRLSYEPASGPLAVDADEHDLEQVLVNILGNAISYTPPGGSISVSVRELDERVQVDVADTGIGISPHERERVFEEFYRTDAAKRVNKEGTGLGLSIVKRLVEGWGGAVWAASPGEGGGTKLCFTVPRPRRVADGPRVT